MFCLYTEKSMLEVLLPPSLNRNSSPNFSPISSPFTLLIYQHKIPSITSLVTNPSLVSFSPEMANPMLALLSINIFFLFQSISAQTPALAPAQAGPTNITKILEKAGQFTTLIKILEATKVDDTINTQLNNSNQGLTVFAPTDNAFANLKPGTLNSINSQEQLQLVQYHVVSSLYTMSQFQTASNPLHTQAGNSDDGEFPLNVTTSGNQVNITTGVVNATVANTIYTDKQLAVYQVDQVLLPPALFGPPPTAAPAPAPTKSEKNVRASDAPSGSSDPTVDTSGVVGLNRRAVEGVAAYIIAVIAMAASCLWL